MPDKPAVVPAFSPVETALYSPLKAFLEAQGFAVKGEICSCDIVAVRGDEPLLVVIVEMKLSFTLELLLQAVDRMTIAGDVWLAVTASRHRLDGDRRVHFLLSNDPHVFACKALGMCEVVRRQPGRVSKHTSQIDEMTRPAAVWR